MRQDEQTNTHKQPSAASIVNYNGLLMNRINTALNFIDHGYSGYHQVLGIRSILKSEFSKEIEPELKVLDLKYIPIFKKLNIYLERHGIPPTHRVGAMELKRDYEMEYTHKALSVIISCLDKHGILEYNERDLIGSGVVF